MRGAFNLGCKLAAVVNGTAHDTLLDADTLERRQRVKDMVDVSVGMTKLVTTRSRICAGIRDATAAVFDRLPRLKAWISSQSPKPTPKYGAGAIVPASLPVSKSSILRKKQQSSVGMLYPQPDVLTADGSELLLDDALGAEWRVLVWNSDPAAFIADDTLRGSNDSK